MKHCGTLAQQHSTCLYTAATLSMLPHTAGAACTNAYMTLPCCLPHLAELAHTREGSLGGVNVHGPCLVVHTLLNEREQAFVQHRAC